MTIVNLVSGGCVLWTDDGIYLSPRDALYHGNCLTNSPTVFTLDHDVSNTSESNLRKYSLIREFAEKHGVTNYPAGRGIGHQIMIEEGMKRLNQFEETLY